MNDIANFNLMAVLGPMNYYRVVEYLRSAYDAPYLVQLTNALSVSDHYKIPVEIDTEVIPKGMEELKRILDMIVDNYRNVTEEQKLLCKSGNTWFVDSCYQYIMSRSKVVKKESYS